MNAWPREKWHCDNSELLLVHLVELVLVKRLHQSLDSIRGSRPSILTVIYCYQEVAHESKWYR